MTARQHWRRACRAALTLLAGGAAAHPLAPIIPIAGEPEPEPDARPGQPGAPATEPVRLSANERAAWARLRAGIESDA